MRYVALVFALLAPPQATRPAQIILVRPGEAAEHLRP
jgi:hypothetical protein